MLSFTDYKRMSLPEAAQLRRNAAILLDASWTMDPAAYPCYLYGHAPLDRHESAVLPAEVKFFSRPLSRPLNQPGSRSMEYEVLLRPSQTVPSWYKDFFGPKAAFPAGLYLDLVDGQDDCSKWLVCDSHPQSGCTASSVLPCNYEFLWTHAGKRFRLWGHSRLKDRLCHTPPSDGQFLPENQEQIWVPKTSFTDSLFYKKRLIISDLRPNPLTWEITDVENTHPFGILKITLSPVPFNAVSDYIDPETGDMWADYHTPDAPSAPLQEPEPDPPYLLSCASSSLKIGGSARCVLLTKKEGPSAVPGPLPDNILWQFTVDGQDISSLLEIVPQGSASVMLRAPETLYPLTDTLLSIRAANVPSHPLTLKLCSL